MAAVVLAVWTVDRMATLRTGGLSLGDVERTTCSALAGHSVAPAVGHLALTGCRLDLPAASIVYDGFELEAVYAPLRTAAGPTLGDIPVVVRTNDPALRATLLELVRQDPPPDDVAAWLDTHAPPLEGAIDGAVLSARHRSATDDEHLSRHIDHTGPGAVLLADPATLPSPWSTGLAALVFGLLAVWGLAFPPSGIVAGTGSRG